MLSDIIRCDTLCLTLPPDQATWHLSQCTGAVIVPVVGAAHGPRLSLPRAALPAPGLHRRDVVVNVHLLSARPQPLGRPLSAAQDPALSARAPGPGVPVKYELLGGHFFRWHSCNPAADQCSDPMWPTAPGPLLCTIWKSLVNNIFMINLHNLFFGGGENFKEKFVNVKTLKMFQSKPKQVFITEMDKTWNKTFQSDLKKKKIFCFSSNDIMGSMLPDHIAILSPSLLRVEARLAMWWPMGKLYTHGT